MLDYSQLQLVFRDSTKFYSAELLKEIDTLRKVFGGVLFIDRVLSALGLAKGTQAKQARRSFHPATNSLHLRVSS
jgi:hypothetical protein